MHKRILMALKKIFNTNVNILKLSKDIQQQKLRELILNNSTSYIERSYNQYRCQMFLISFYKKVFLNLLSTVLFLPTILFYTIRGMLYLFVYKKERREASLLDAAFFGVDRNIIPKSLYTEFNIIQVENKPLLYFKDLSFVFKNAVWLYHFDSYFYYKILVKVAQYRGSINTNNLKAIIVTSEYSFTSSIMTQYCEENNIEHINVMHGDKLYYIRDSFFKFNRCYVWDEHYKNLFTNMMADREQFIIEKLNLLIPKKGEYYCKDNNGKIIITYYLQYEDAKTLHKIKNYLAVLSNDYYVNIRPHPIYSDRKAVSKVFEPFSIEDLSKVDIYESIIKSDIIISSYSTVLLQGYLLGKKIVIDDLTGEGIYNKLVELNYILINKPHERLSDYVNC